MAHVTSWFASAPRLIVPGMLAGIACASWSGSAKAQDPNAPAPAPAAAPATATATVGTTGATSSVDTTPVANPDLGEVGAFVIDQVSGFRGRVGGGVGYYGPLGVAYNTFSGQTGQQISFGTGGAASASSTETTINSWSIWLAPSIDYFLFPNVSVGGLFAVDTSFGSTESKTTVQTAGGNTVQTSSGDLPTVTSFTLMPRVGYFIRINDRLSFWPRVGVGYFSGSNAAVDTQQGSAGNTITVTRTQSISSLLVQLDVGVIYQITDNVFFRIAPAVAFSSNGSSTVKYKASNGNQTPPEQSGDGKAFQFELSSGFGANFSL